MTPARLEEIEAIDALDQCDGCRQDMCCDACDEARVHRSNLLAEVKRLREVLGRLVASATVVETISLDPRTPGKRSKRIEVEARAFTLAKEALEEKK